VRDEYPSEDHDRVFEVGYSTAEAGTGYGVHIVERIIESHDWQIHVSVMPDGGARFEITTVDTGETAGHCILSNRNFR